MHASRSFRRLAISGAIIAVAAGGPPRASADELTLHLQNGRVTLVAVDVPVSAILDEWARVGQTNFVNADQVSGDAVTLRFENVPEREVLDILLRSASGYMAAPRPTQVPSASIYDRVLVMGASSTAARAGSGPRPRPSRRTPGGRTPFATPQTPMFPADSDESAPGMQGPESGDQVPGPATAGSPPYPTPANQPLTPLLPGGVPGSAPTPSNPFGIPAGAAATPGIMVQPEQPEPPNRTP